LVCSIAGTGAKHFLADPKALGNNNKSHLTEAFVSGMFDPGDANHRARAFGIIITTTIIIIIIIKITTTTGCIRPIAFEKLHAAA
jgi:hypothetical protein